MLHYVSEHLVMSASFTIWYDTVVAHKTYMQYLSHAGIYAECGVDQGCCLAVYAYAMGFKAATREIRQQVQALDPDANMLVYLDEGYL